jgi:ADP-ribose pyrophosphatase
MAVGLMFHLPTTTLNDRRSVLSLREPLPPAKRMVSSRSVHKTPWVRVREDEIVDGNGLGSSFTVVERASFVVVICPVVDSLVLVRQFRYAAGSWQWELPQGALDPGEQIAHAAARELREETGWHTDIVSILLDGLYEAGDWATQTFGIAVAPGVRQTPRHALPGEHIAEVRTTPVGEVKAMAAAGLIADPPSLCALYLWEFSRARGGF